MNCPICTHNSKKEFSLPKVELHRCLNCDHCFSTVDSDQSKTHYPQDYYLEQHKKYFNTIDINFFKYCHKLIEKHPGSPHISILDVGCGTGSFLKHVYHILPELNLTGIDLGYQANHNSIKFINSDFLAHNFERKFDLIISIQVIEHLEQVHQFTQKMHALLEPNGSLIISTIDDRSAAHSMARFVYGLGYEAPLTRLYDKHHLNHFSRSSLAKLLELENFKIIQQFPYDMPFAALDVPASGGLKRYVQLFLASLTLVIGKLTGKNILQTVYCQKLQE